LILLAESANKSSTRAEGQELIGGLDVRVQRNYFGRQVESFEADLRLKFLEGQEAFHSVFIRAPVVEKVLDASEVEALGSAAKANGEDGDRSVVRAPAVRGTKAEVEILCRLPGRAKAIRDQTTTAEDLGEDGDIVAVRQGNVFGTSFHPELTGDERIHAWWLGEVVKAAGKES
jgi:5'-phosphate synthase pdxT subunit